jgi:DNA (cytosine-5)-methyltransferase 1
MPLPLQYGSVCSGIEAVSLAWRPLGWQPAWFAEIDPFACAVLAHHYPTVPNLGDMTTLAARVLCGEVSAPDLLVGGTPCQAFSIAGARKGLADPRGSLTLSYTELAHAIDAIRQTRNLPPAVIVWENVPGVLSDRSNAFGVFLGALAGEGHPLEPPGGKWTHAGDVSGCRRRIAWRVLCAQHFGLAQRRRRVFLVASGRAGFDPGEVLFERDGLPGHPAPGGETRQETAGAAARCADCPNRTLGFGGGNRQGPIAQAACLTAKGYSYNFEETFAVQSCTGPISHALTTANHGKGCSEDGSGKGVPVIAFAQNSRNELRLEAGQGRIVGTLSSSGGGKPGQGRPVVLGVALRGRAGGMTAELGDERASALRASGGSGSGSKNYVVGELATTLRAKSGNGEENYVVEPAPQSASYPCCPLDDDTERIWRARRLMPVECERLQGLPDHYTLIPYHGRLAADAPRYRVIGNSMAAPCMAWLGRRLQGALS